MLGQVYVALDHQKDITNSTVTGPGPSKKHMILRTNRYEQVRTPNVPPTNPFLMLFLGVCGRCPVNYLRMMTLCGWFSVDLAGTMSCLCSSDMASPLVGFCVAAVWWVWLVTCAWLSGFHSRGAVHHTQENLHETKKNNA